MKVKVSVPEGKTLYQVLRDEGFISSAYCGGRGICGKCLVKVNGKEELACLLFGPFEGEVELSDKELVRAGGELPPIPVDEGLKGFGVALDVGTTSVEAALFKLETGEFVSCFKSLNLQSSFGSDVVSRVEQAREAYCKERELLLETVELLLKQFKVKPSFVVAVSNPVIHHFLLNLPVSGFEKFPFKLYQTEEVCITGKELGFNDFSDALFYFPPPLKNFVGSDFLSNFLVLEELSDSFLVADLGTNAEMGLYGKSKKVATSVPAGPAFEGVGLFSGMSAERGAVYKVFFDGRAFRFLTVGGEKPKGLCASGYFDLIYYLKSFRALNSEGTFVENPPFLIKERIREINGEKAFVLYEDEETVVALTQTDLRKFLLAKGAVYGALKRLSQEGSFKELFFSGAFGSHIWHRSIKALKLTPENFPEPKPMGNLALKGASLLLGSRRKRERIVSLKKETLSLELATDKGFEKAYIEGMEI
ncbi:ASKHA domain-containing protein [Thermovibrio sp.]